nr:MAG TPA: hypothetical protein [Caudoviricetes sp.]
MSKYAYTLVAAATLAVAAPVFYNLGRMERTVFYSKLFNYSCHGQNQMLRKLCVELLNKDLKLTMSLPEEN